jgi:hypothetical protein
LLNHRDQQHAGTLSCFLFASLISNKHQICETSNDEHLKSISVAAFTSPRGEQLFLFAQESNYRRNSFISKTKAGNERMTGLITGKSLIARISFHSKQAYHDDTKTEIELKFLNVKVLLNKHSSKPLYTMINHIHKKTESKNKPSDVNVLNNFTEILRDSAKEVLSMKQRKLTSKNSKINKPRQKWFNEDCHTLKRNLRNLGSLLAKYPSDPFLPILRHTFFTKREQSYTQNTQTTIS